MPAWRTGTSGCSWRSTRRRASRCGASSRASCARRSAPGRLRTGVRLPASRALAAQLGVSRGVVTDAYEQLSAEGWLAARRGAGTVVAAGAGRASPRAPSRRAAPPCASTSRRRRPTSRSSRAARGPAPSPAPRPRRPTPSSTTAAASAACRCARRSPATSAACAAPPPARPGSSSARATARPCGCCSGVLAERGKRRVAFEDPSLARPLGRGGPRRPGDRCRSRSTRRACAIDALERADADAVVVTPSHQFPTGAVMGPERRHALLRWARAGDRLVIEDDYDAEFRYDRRPLGGAAGARPRPRGLRRHGVQDAGAGAAAGLDPRARGARPRAGGREARRGLRLARARPARARRPDRLGRARPPPAPRPARLRRAPRPAGGRTRPCAARARGSRAPPRASTSCSPCPTRSTPSRCARRPRRTAWRRRRSTRAFTGAPPRRPDAARARLRAHPHRGRRRRRRGPRRRLARRADLTHSSAPRCRSLPPQPTRPRTRSRATPSCSLRPARRARRAVRRGTSRAPCGGCTRPRASCAAATPARARRSPSSSAGCRPTTSSPASAPARCSCSSRTSPRSASACAGGATTTPRARASASR